MPSMFNQSSLLVWSSCYSGLIFEHLVTQLPYMQLMFILCFCDEYFCSSCNSLYVGEDKDNLILICLQEGKLWLGFLVLEQQSLCIKSFFYFGCVDWKDKKIVLFSFFLAIWSLCGKWYHFVVGLILLKCYVCPMRLPGKDRNDPQMV